MHAIRRLLRALAVHSLRCKVGGIACLRRLAIAARASTSRGVLNGYAHTTALSQRPFSIGTSSLQCLTSACTSCASYHRKSLTNEPH